jgi:hypothetical protein
MFQLVQEVSVHLFHAKKTKVRSKKLTRLPKCESFDEEFEVIHNS